MRFVVCGPPAAAIYTLSLHDALPIFGFGDQSGSKQSTTKTWLRDAVDAGSEILVRTAAERIRSEEHTSELQSRFDIVCRLLLEKKKTSATPRRSNPATRGRHWHSQRF